MHIFSLIYLLVTGSHNAIAYGVVADKTTPDNIPDGVADGIDETKFLIFLLLFLMVILIIFFTYICIHFHTKLKEIEKTNEDKKSERCVSEKYDSLSNEQKKLVEIYIDFLKNQEINKE